MEEKKEDEVKRKVREGYAKIAMAQGSCCSQDQAASCCDPTASCCGSSTTYEERSKEIGYSEEDLRSVPEGANLGLGCGNPVALASLKEGETVIDLGSGAGFDCFLAARRVGEKGRVIGVDMTPEMIDKARENAGKGGFGNVEFRLGEIENLPVADNTADIIISNCVINLSPNKQRVFEEAFRALKPSGRLMVSDIVLLKELPEAVRNSEAALIGCVAGAMMRDKYLETMRQAGFQEVKIADETRFSLERITSDPVARAAVEISGESVEQVEAALNSVASVKVSATKPVS